MSSTSTISSAETVADMVELLDQILISLPALSLIRFKTVSKHWLSLISNPEFHRRHTLQNPNPKVSAFFSCQIQEKLFKSIPLSCPSGNPFKTLVSSVPDNSLRILQSCNGLFLCRIRNFIKDDTNFLYVVNPTTNKFLALSAPSLEKNQDPYKFVRYALAFDPSMSPYYKVICVSNRDGYYYFGHHQIDIYSSETADWVKHLEVPFFPSPSDVGRHHDLIKRAMHFNYRSNESAVYCNGAIHWIRETRYAELGFDDDLAQWLRREWDVLHYFDINKECLRLAAVTPPVPLCVKNIPLKQDGDPTVWPHLVHRCCGDSSGRLYLIETYRRCYVFVVMEMETDYSGWTVKYHVDLVGPGATLPRLHIKRKNVFGVLGIFRDEERDDVNSSTGVWLHLPGKVLSYKHRSSTFKTIADLAEKNDDRSRLFNMENYAYKESLVCV